MFQFRKFWFLLGCSLGVVLGIRLAYGGCTTLVAKSNQVAARLGYAEGEKLIQERGPDGRKVVLDGTLTVMVADRIVRSGGKEAFSDRRGGTLTLRLNDRTFTRMYQSEDPSNAVCFYLGCLEKPYPAGPTEADLFNDAIVHNRMLMQVIDNPDTEEDIRLVAGAEGLPVIVRSGQPLAREDGRKSDQYVSSVTLPVRIVFFLPKNLPSLTLSQLE